MSKKIVFFDIDGTIYCHQTGKISNRVRDAITKTREKGVLCFIASGRPQGFIAENVKKIGFDGYVLANGANIKYQGKDLAMRYLHYQDMKELCVNLQKRQIEYVLQTPTLCYLRKTCENLLAFYKLCNIDFENFDFDYNEDEIIRQTVKLEILANNGKDFEYAKECCHAFTYEEHKDMLMLEVYAKDVSKATGILDVLKLLDISLDHSYCFGDGANDIEMFETVGHPIAMGNAIKDIKELAEDICLSVEDDGVAYKLEELF